MDKPQYCITTVVCSSFFFETDVIFWKLLLFSYFICEEKRTEKTGRKYVEYYSMVSIISPGCLIDTF